MFGSWFEAAIIIVILAGIVVAIFKGGAANPVGTGGLKSQLVTIDNDLSALKTKVGGVETRVSELDKRAATKGDIERIETRFNEWERKLERLDNRLDATDLELGKIGSQVGEIRNVVDSMVEGLRVTNATMHKIETRTEANAAITAQVPAFMEKVLTAVATNSAQTIEVCKQVDRLYDFIVDKGMSK